MSLDLLKETYPDLVLADGFDECIIGVAHRFGMEDCIAYDFYKVIETLMNKDGMTYEEALEYYDFNIIGAYVGEHTPIFIENF